jgi:hypothetical protein
MEVAAMVKNLHGDTQTPELGSSPSKNNTAGVWTSRML